MMNYLFAAMIILAAVWGIFTGRSAEISQSILQSGSSTVQLMLTITGAMSLWNGIMAIAERSELTSHAAVFLGPAVRRLMPDLDKGSEAERFVCMNIISNILGLGNAATPLGLKAMAAMKQKSHGETATHDMITFAVINTASIQLVPTTLLIMRSQAGSSDPMCIMPCVWLTSIAALGAGLTTCFILKGVFKG